MCSKLLQNNGEIHIKIVQDSDGNISKLLKVVRYKVNASHINKIKIFYDVFDYTSRRTSEGLTLYHMPALNEKQICSLESTVI